MIHLTKQTAYQLDLVVSSVLFFFHLCIFMHVLLMSVLLSCLFLVVQLHLEFPREGVALTCTQLQQQNSPTAHSSHTSASVCVQIQAGALLEIEYIWKSPFQDFLPPLSVFLAGEFVKKLESYLPQRKAVLNYGLGQWKWHMGSAAASEATFFQ